METFYEIPVLDGNPHPLGRHVAHDENSRKFPVRALFGDTPPPLKNKRWSRTVAITDQGQLGSCTAHAALGCLSTRPFTKHFRSLKIIEKFYTDETKADEFTGYWPPDDTGSDGNTGGKVARDRGYITEWRHCFSLNDVLTAVMTGPLITGTNWYEGMFNPNSDGRVSISGAVAGGHEWCIVGINIDAKTIIAANSWGAGWANKGYFTISFDDYDRLLHEDGDATVFIR